MNVIDWLRASADFLASDRPDVYDTQTAIEELSVAMDALRDGDYRPYSCMTFTSYMLSRIVEEDVEEFILSRKVSSLLLFGAEEECRAYSHTNKVNLPGILDAEQDF